MAATEQEKTPLQQKLDEFGEQLSKVGEAKRAFQICITRVTLSVYLLVLSIVFRTNDMT